MYKSPIELVNSFTPMTVQRYDDAIMTEVLAKVDVIVDKEELMKALQYDRNQYMKGYKDGVEYAKPNQVKADWIPTGCEEEEYYWVGECARCHESVFYDNYCPNCGAKLIKPDREEWWLPEKKEEPKPEKPKPEGYGECWACRYASWDSKEKDWMCCSVVLCTGGQCWKSRKVEEDG